MSWLGDYPPDRTWDWGNPLPGTGVPRTGAPPERPWDQRLGRDLGPETGYGQTHICENSTFSGNDDWNYMRILNKKVLLRERKRHTARRVASARYAAVMGWEGYPISGRGYPVPGLGRGVPHLWSGKGGYPIPGLCRGYLSQVQVGGGGYPISGLGGGYPRYPPVT